MDQRPENSPELHSRGRVSFYTLGCKVNQYETQMMKESFAGAGYEIAEEESFADIYVVNTCSVTNLSDRKSRQFIRRMHKINPQAVIAVTGCYSQTDPQAVSELEGVCVVTGTSEKSDIVDYVESYISKRNAGFSEKESHVAEYEELDHYQETGIITAMDSRTRAYIKVQEGCNRFCSYCIIPYARGKVRSRGLKEIKAEAEALIAAGFKELVLTGINTALYGEDQEADGDVTGIERLIAAIDSMEGDFRIRLSSLEPNVVDVKTVKSLEKYHKLCHHMHLSIQSGSTSVLKRMNRRYDYETYRKIADALKAQDPLYAITTDIITGFPGETESEFQESIQAVRENGFAGVHAFRYSKRRGTKAAQMPDQIDGNTKNDRIHRIMEAAREASEEFRKKNIGRKARVLFERIDYEKKLIEGYSDNYIRVYCSVKDTADPDKLLDSFQYVSVTGLYDDGVMGIL